MRASPGSRPARRLQDRACPLADWPGESRAALRRLGPGQTVGRADRCHGQPQQAAAAGDGRRCHDPARSAKITIGRNSSAVRTAIDARDEDQERRLMVAAAGEHRRRPLCLDGHARRGCQELHPGCALLRYRRLQALPGLHGALAFRARAAAGDLPAGAGVLAARSPMGPRACAAVCDAGRLVQAGHRAVGAGAGNLARQRRSGAHLYGRREGPLCCRPEEGNRRARSQTKKAAYEEVVVPWLPAPSGWEGFDAESAKDAREEYIRRSSAQRE